MTFVDITVVFAIVEAGGVHALSATLTTPASSVHFDGHAIAEFVLVYTLAQLDHRAHVFVARCKVLVEWKTTVNQSGWALVDDFQIGRANSNCIDAHQHLSGTWLRDRLVHKGKLFGVSKDPSFHGCGNFVAALAQEGCICVGVHLVSKG